MGFGDVLLFCAANEDFVRAFDRLAGAALSDVGKPGLGPLIDLQTGRVEADVRKFAAFVYDAVWCRLPPECFEEVARGA